MGRVRLRLARFGSRNRPFYRIVAVDSRRKRDGMPLEYVCLMSTVSCFY